MPLFGWIGTSAEWIKQRARRPFERARNVAIVFGVVLLIGFAGGVWFYTHRWSDLTDPDVAKCIYGEPVCSLTVATWVLCVMTTGAFLAAFAAAGWAKLAFEHEINPRLGEDGCFDDDHVADREFYLSADGNVIEYPPFDESDPEEDYDRLAYAFTNLGRSALGNVYVQTRFVTVTDDVVAERELSLGNIGVSDERCEKHVVFYIHKSWQLVEPRFVWATQMGRRIREFLCTDAYSVTEQVALPDPIGLAVDAVEGERR